MDKEILNNIEAIIRDTASPVDERIDTLFAMAEDDDESPEKNVIISRAIIDLIKEEDATASHVNELLCSYLLLAQAYDELEDYPPLDRLAFEVREVLRDSRIAWEVIDQTLPPLIDILGETVFHHETYRLLLVYLRAAFDAGELSDAQKGYARHFLKLRLLLEDAGSWGCYLLTKEMEQALASLFTPVELMKIIMNPAIGRLKSDPVEYTRRWEDIYYEVERKLDERFANAPRGRGFCHQLWNAKRDLLRDEYGIDWRSPSQMNPRVRFD